MMPLFFCLSLLVMAMGIFSLFRRSGHINSVLTPYRKLMVFLFLSEVLYFVPYYLDYFHSVPLWEQLLNTLLLSVHHAIRLFVAGAEYDPIRVFGLASPMCGQPYALYGAVLYVASPAMTFGFILSFFQGLTSHLRLSFHHNRNLYIFSELNTRTLHLAHSIRRRFPKALLLFCDVYQTSNEDFSELETNARKLQAICFRKDILSLNATLPRTKGKLQFFIFGVNDNENISQANALIHAPDRRKKEIYVRSYTGNYLFDDLPTPDHVSLYRVDHIHSLVHRTILHHGPELLRNAHADGHVAPQFNSLIIGLGRYGTEMTKSLSWYTQVEGSITNIHCFDRDPLAEERFRHNYPGYFSGEPATRYCRIHIHAGVPMNTVTMDEKIRQLGSIHYVLVSLGDDDSNIQAAYELRALFRRLGQHPVIHAIVYNSDKCNMLRARKTTAGLDYDLHFFGAEEDLFSYEAVVENNLLGYNADHALRLHDTLLRNAGLNVSGEARDRSRHRQWLNFNFSMGYRRSADGSAPDLAHLLTLPADHRERSLAPDDLTKVNPSLLDYEDHMALTHAGTTEQ